MAADGSKTQKKAGNKSKSCSFQNYGKNSPKSGDFWSGHKKEKSRNPHGYWIFRWRSGWDSNPRAREDYLISSAAPSTTRTTLHMSIRKSFPKLLERTDGKNTNFIQFSNCETPHKHWISCGQNLHCFKKFRVSPVMITSLRLPLSLATR